MIADDLFAGAGGWDLAAAQLGIHARGVENMKEAPVHRQPQHRRAVRAGLWPNRQHSPRRLPLLPQGGTMTDHAIRWTFDRDTVFAEAVCHAAPGADCRLTSVSCECEMWGEIWRRDDGTIWHKIVDYGDSIEPRWHEVKPQDDCNVCLFINESGCVEELGAGTFVIGETPIRPLWVDGGCDWERVDEEIAS